MKGGGGIRSGICAALCIQGQRILREKHDQSCALEGDRTIFRGTAHTSAAESPGASEAMTMCLTIKPWSWSGVKAREKARPVAERWNQSVLGRDYDARSGGPASWWS